MAVHGAEVSGGWVHVPPQLQPQPEPGEFCVACQLQSSSSTHSPRDGAPGRLKIMLCLLLRVQNCQRFPLLRIPSVKGDSKWRIPSVKGELKWRIHSVKGELKWRIPSIKGELKWRILSVKRGLKWKSLPSQALSVGMELKIDAQNFSPYFYRIQ